VKVTLLPSTTHDAGETAPHYLTTYLINDALAVDAGGLGLWGTPADQARIRHVLISHSHIDHIASLPVFLENAYEGRSESVVVHASDAVLDSLRQDIFNGRVWPDFLALSPPGAPFLRLATLRPGEPVELGGLRITPVPVNHVVPTLGFLIEDESSAVVIASDTGPTEEIWERADQVANLRAIFLEVTFPEALASLAAVVKHLTPGSFALELKKLKQRPIAFAVHIKARYYDQVVRELRALGLSNVEIALAGHPYIF